MNDIIDVKGVVAREMFPYNQDTMFGGYAFRLVWSSMDIKINKTWNTFVVTGNCPQLLEGKEYEFTMTPTKHKRYGDGYGFVEVKERKLNSVEEQQEYLRQIISSRDAETLIQAYPKEMIVDFIKEDKVDVSQLKGIKETKLHKIKDKLSMYENLQLALVELKDLGISMTSLQKLVSHFGSQEVLIDKIKENIYILTKVDMFGFTKVDEYAMKRGDDPESRFRILACFEHIVKEEGSD